MAIDEESKTDDDVSRSNNDQFSNIGSFLPQEVIQSMNNDDIDFSK